MSKDGSSEAATLQRLSVSVMDLQSSMGNSTQKALGWVGKRDSYLRAIDEQIGQPRRQHGRLLLRAVKCVQEVHSVILQISEQGG